MATLANPNRGTIPTTLFSFILATYLSARAFGGAIRDKSSEMPSIIRANIVLLNLSMKHLQYLTAVLSRAQRTDCCGFPRWCPEVIDS
jgi:hypothetical protein